MTGRRALRVPFAVSAASIVAGMTLALVPASATPGGIPSDNVERASGSPFSLTRTLTRTFVNDDGTSYDFPANTVTVDASQTKDLRGRQRILVSWTGAQPSGGRASNPYGENGLQQEYPVVILQCRGTDDPSLPLDQQVRPETCWTGSVAQRSQITRGDAEASWIHDLAGLPADKDRLTGMAPFPGKEVCPNADADGLYTHLTPFVTAAGRVYAACDSSNMPPEAAVGAAFPPAEISAYSDEDGAGSVQFEVRSDVENESLGCNDKVACTIEVIPINGISCDQGSMPLTISDSACRKGGQFPPGSSNFANQGVDQAVSPVLWWSPSNWANRFTIPITFGLPPDTCDVLDPRAPTGFYGSELMAQASIQWAPAYCLDKKRFKFQLNQMSDAAGWNLMESGVGPAAFVSSPHRKTSDDRVGFAPTAVTGFAIGYNIDRPDNAGEYTDLRLNPRLVAKLLTESYLGSELGRGHPGIGNNPIAIMNDPEFMALNPGLSQISQEAGASLLSLSNDSDIVQQLTDWIAHDRDAMDFINGKADPWGMKVNPAYKKIKVPRSEWPLLDTYIPATNNTCRQANPNVYFSQLAAPVSTLRKVSDALLDGWPNVQTRCDFDQVSNTYKLGRVDRQSYGARFMLGVVSLGDAARYGLHTAALQTKKGSYVAPSEDSLLAAVNLMEPKQPGKRGKGGKGGKGGNGNGSHSARLLAKPAVDTPDLSQLGRPYVLDQADVRKSGKAYPGTVVVYTAARLQNLDPADAKKVALFIRTATTEGQKEGAGNGQLPAGFVPMQKAGPTKKLFDTAQEVAYAVEAQTPEPTEAPSASSPTDTAAPTLPPNTGDSGPVDAPSGDVPTDVPSAAPSASPSATGPPAPLVMPQTQAVSSDLGDRAVPVLLILGLVGIALTSAVRFFVRPPRGTAPVTATLPDRDTETVTPPASSPASSPGPTPARPAKAPEPRLPRPGDDLWTVVSTAGTMVAIVCLWVVGQMLFLSGFAENRSQELLYREFRVAIAGDPDIVPPIGPTTPVGDPVALLSIPRIGVSQVVVEGTASGDTLAGPGHLRNTVLPGQAGTSVVFGRAATYGAPFRDLDKLHRGDTIDVVMAQGEVKDFTVVNIRRAGDPYSQPLPAGGARLILATAEGSGPLAALSPGSVLYVDADAPRGFIPPSGLPATVPDPEQIMHSDHGAFPLLALHLALLLAATLGVVVARQRWSAPLVWIVAAPVAVALAWSTTDVVMRLLPNVV